MEIKKTKWVCNFYFKKQYRMTIITHAISFYQAKRNFVYRMFGETSIKYVKYLDFNLKIYPGNFNNINYINDDELAKEILFYDVEEIDKKIYKKNGYDCGDCIYQGGFDDDGYWHDQDFCTKLHDDKGEILEDECGEYNSEKVYRLKNIVTNCITNKKPSDEYLDYLGLESEDPKDEDAFYF